MPQGDKSKYTAKQKRKAEHIEEGYEKKGVPEKEAERRAWATVNKQEGGGKKGGAGRSDSSPRSKAARKDSARRASRTRASNKHGAGGAGSRRRAKA